MSHSRLLVAVSSPWASQKFAAPIIDLAQRLDAETLVAHVARPQDEDEDESNAKQRGEETLKLLTDTLRESGVKADGIMLFSDDVPKAILNTAKARNCTLIVLGLTCKSVWKRLIAGNVPRHIIGRAEVPILLYPMHFNGMV